MSKLGSFADLNKRLFFSFPLGSIKKLLSVLLDKRLKFGFWVLVYGVGLTSYDVFMVVFISLIITKVSVCHDHQIYKLSEGEISMCLT